MTTTVFEKFGSSIAGAAGADRASSGTRPRAESTATALLLAVAGVVFLLVVLEGRRQARIYGQPSGRPNLAGAGILDLQNPSRPPARREARRAEARRVRRY